MRPVLVPAEDAAADDGPVSASTRSLLALAARIGEPFLVPMPAPDSFAPGARRAPSAHLDRLVRLARDLDPAAILLPAGALGDEIAARLAVRLESGLITGALDVLAGPDGPIAVTAAQRGEDGGEGATTAPCLVESVICRGIPIITVRCHADSHTRAADRDPARIDGAERGLAPAADPDPDPEARLAALCLAGFADPARRTLCGRTQSPVRLVSRRPRPARPDLAEASIVVAGGRGVGSAAGFDLIRAVADALGAAVGGSHTAVELGWCPASLRIGQCGAAVRPRLYLACGISGSVRHRAGIQGAKTVVAIDRDPRAPIFRAADLAVVGDLHQILPRLLTEIARRTAPRRIGTRDLAEA